MIQFPIEGVVFDVDGVLFDTERLMHRIWIEVSAEMGDPRPGEDYLDYVGNGRSVIFEKMEALYGPDFPKEEFLTRCSQTLQDRLLRDGVPLKPGVSEILELLRQAGIPMALATSTAMRRTGPRMELTGLTRYFTAMITGDQVEQGKPHPEIYQKACRALGTHPARTLAVEDSRNGILSASAAGMPVVMVPDMIPPSPELEELILSRFSSLEELAARLRELEQFKK